MPTFLAAAGLPRPEDMPAGSADLIDIHRNNTPRNRYVGASDHHYALIEGDWKYIFVSEGGSELLFNLTNDPMEQRNLAPQHPDICSAMQRQLAEEMGQHGFAGIKSGADKLPVKPARGETPRQERWPGFHSHDNTPHDVLH
jgi:arylsulfatase A-like enzyme